MKTNALIFTCEKHIVAAEIAATCASRFFDVHLVLDSKDKGASAKFPVIRTEFARGGNLTGQDATIGVAKTMMSMVKNGRVMKIDSDTVIHDDSYFPDCDIAGFTHPHAPAALLGCCYSISERTLAHTIDCLSRLKEMNILANAEDVLITSYAMTHRVDGYTNKVTTSKRLGVWHPTIAPIMKGRVANFGNHRINGEWCHPEAMAAMGAYAILGADKGQQ